MQASACQFCNTTCYGCLWSSVAVAFRLRHEFYPVFYDYQYGESQKTFSSVDRGSVFLGTVDLGMARLGMSDLGMVDLGMMNLCMAYLGMADLGVGGGTSFKGSDLERSKL